MNIKKFSNHFASRARQKIGGCSLRAGNQCSLGVQLAAKSCPVELPTLPSTDGSLMTVQPGKLRPGPDSFRKIPFQLPNARDCFSDAKTAQAAKPATQSTATDITRYRRDNSLVHPALFLALNAGLRDKESRELRWEQIDMVDKKTLVVGQSKTDAGTGRVIPLNRALLEALIAHATWHTNRFKECKPEWFVFAFGRPLPCDPTRHATTFKTVWTTVRADSAVSGRWHDNRHTLVTELAETGAGDETIMAIAGHVSRQMLSRYSHIRMEAKRKALEEIVSKPAPAQQAPQPTAEQKPPDTAPQRVQ